MVGEREEDHSGDGRIVGIMDKKKEERFDGERCDGQMATLGITDQPREEDRKFKIDTVDRHALRMSRKKRAPFQWLKCFVIAISL